MPKKDATKWIDLPFLREKDAVAGIRKTVTQLIEGALGDASTTRQVLFYIPSTAAVGTDLSAQALWRGADGTTIKIDASCKTAPVGAALIHVVKSGGTTVGTVTIADGATTGTTTSLSVGTIRDNNTLTVDCTQVGSGTAGADVTVILECTVEVET
jgi:hypothetical protein